MNNSQILYALLIVVCIAVPCLMVPELAPHIIFSVVGTAVVSFTIFILFYMFRGWSEVPFDRQWSTFTLPKFKFNFRK